MRQRRDVSLHYSLLTTHHSLLCDPEVPASIAPGAMNVVGRVLGGVGLDVQEFDHERRGYHTVTVRFAVLGAPGVSEMDLVDACLLCFRNVSLSDFVGHPLGVGGDQLLERISLLLGHLFG